VLQLVEEAFDEIALAINGAVDRTMNKSAAEAWNVRPCPSLTNEVENGITIVAAIGDNVASRPEVAEEAWHGALVVGLSSGENDANRQAIVVHDCVNLGAQSPTREADGVILAPFLPPAAC
jgi:hypothetical protein